MINLLRNREALAHLTLVAALGAAGAVLCFILGGALPGLVALGAAAAMTACTIRFTKSRYRDIARFSDSLAKIAVGDYGVDLREYEEGELSVLYDELHKVTRTLSHQAEELRKDKLWLADTMADISHQLKTPLTSAAMLTDLLGAPNLPPEKREEFLSGLQTGIERIRWLVLSLLKLSRLDADAVVFRREPLTVQALLERALEPLRIPMELREQSLALAVDDAVVTGDISWLAEAVGNVLMNCVEHAPVGGAIRIRCTENPLYTLLEIRDNGPGIPAEDLPHIFERFYRGKNASADSIGIGLALSKSIINRHGGVIEAASGTDGGSCFRVKLFKTAV